MAQFTVSITKDVNWRGHREQFANVYTYINPVDGSTEAVANDVLTALVAAERAVHAGDVNFVEGRAWTSGGTTTQNELLFIRDLSGAGEALGHVAMDKEACYVVKFECNREDVRGRKVWLRKWIHAGSLLGGFQDWLSGTQQISAAARAAVEAYAAEVYDPLFGEVDLSLASPSGRTANGTIEVYPYVEHHEFT